MKQATLRERMRTPNALRDFGIRALTAVAMGAVLVVAVSDAVTCGKTMCHTSAARIRPPSTAVRPTAPSSLDVEAPLPATRCVAYRAAATGMAATAIAPNTSLGLRRSVRIKA